jgi:Bacterial Ig-like domain (group 3)/FG-GAP-like repeat
MNFRNAAFALLCFAFAVPNSTLGATLFQTARTFSSGAVTPVSIVAADMNGDGKPDIIAFNQCTATNCDGTVTILLGNGDGTFQAAKTFDTGLTFGNSIAVVDLNGDSKLDVVAMSGASCGRPECLSYFSVMFGNGDGTLGPSHKYSTGAYESQSMGLADVNQDGNVDLVIGSLCSTPSCDTDSAVSVLLGKGDGSFQPAQVFDSGAQQLGSIALSDVNGDGKVDVLVAHYYGGLGTLLGNGDGTFRAAQLMATGVYLNSVISADLNHDGKPDVIIGAGHDFGTGVHAAAGILLGNGDGTFQAVRFYDTNAQFRSLSMVAGDVNGDGKLDLIVAVTCPGFCNTSPVVVLPGNGDGTFQNGQRYLSGGSGAEAIALADLNGDSKPDIAVANKCVSGTDCTTGSVGILLGISGVQTTTELISSLNPSLYGQAVTLTASVTSIGKSIPTGTVTFWNGSSRVGIATLSGGVAALVKTNLPAGSLSVTATYSGDANSAKSASASLLQVVKKASTTTAVSSSLNPSNEGQSVTFTATVTSPTTRATGTVTFARGGQALGTITLSGGRAKFTTSTLPHGSNGVTAAYNGTSNITGSKGSVTQVVN